MQLGKQENLLEARSKRSAIVISIYDSQMRADREEQVGRFRKL